ncbi:MAG: glycosyltransferase family 2 protein [Patescibacteria group bacterium]|jgi:dolichol-phosphate mannosyltransferase
MDYSLVIPVYNEQDNVEQLYERTRKVMVTLKKKFELIFINDGSHDSTQELLTKLHAADDKVKVINFSRNFGHQVAVTAGLKFATGKKIAILDADLQDPPEVLPTFFAKLDEGFDVVYAIRKHRKENFVKRFSYFVFYRLLKTIASISIPLDSGDFCVMSSRVVSLLNTLPERNRFIRGLRSWVGFKQVGVAYDRDNRHAGNSKYTLHKMFKLAFDGIFSFSYVPLQLLTFAGFLFFVLSIVGSIITVYAKFFTSVYIPRGFPTTIITILFIGGINMLALGIMGEYIGRIYDEVKHRSPFIIESTLGLGEK